MFELVYKSGNSFADSFFVGRDGDSVKMISASEVLPLDVQKKIVAAEAEFVEEIPVPETDKAAVENLDEASKKLDSVQGDIAEAKAHEQAEMGVEPASKKVDIDAIHKKAGVPTPEAIVKAIAQECKDFAGFEKFCVEAKAAHDVAMKKEASMKKQAAEGKVSDGPEMTFNRTEDGKVPQEKIGTEPEFSVNQKEAQQDLKDGLKDGKSQSSPVKSYFGRLPNAGQDTVETTINIQSSLKEQYKKLSAAFEELKKENDKTKEDLGKATEELGKAKEENKEMKDEMAMDNNKKTVDSIVAEIKKIVKVEKENVFVDKLVKLDEKSLKIVLDVVKEIGKLNKDSKDEKDVAGLFGGEEKGKEKEDKGLDLGLKSASKKMPGENIPQLFSEYGNQNISSLTNLFEE